MPPDRLTTRELNRATLARQHLLARSDLGPLEMVEHLVGMQGQVPLDPYTGLWSRIERFEPTSLAALLMERRAVRITAMRATIHLLSADDCLRLRPLMQPVLDAELRRHPEFAPKLAGADLEAVLRIARAALGERPRTGPELRAVLAERFPRRDPAALAYACRCLLPLVQVPPRGVWGQSSQVAVTTTDAWLGRSLDRAPSLDDVVLRYLGAFGPASVADVTTWCRLTGLRAVVDRLRPHLREFRAENGRELLDLAEMPLPDADTPAPTRFLPEYDNVLLSHADRTRIALPHRRAALARVWKIGFGSVLHDGFLAGVWRLERDRSSGEATLAVTVAERLPKRAIASIEAEGRRYTRFAAADRDSHVRVDVADARAA